METREPPEADMTNAKQRVRELLDRLPDDCTLEEIQYHLYVIQQIELGLADSEAGRAIPHEEVAAELRSKWTIGRTG